MTTTEGHLGFTGTSKGMSYMQLLAVKDLLDDWDYTTLHHGDCVGADAQAHDIAMKYGYNIVIWPPENPRYRNYCDRKMPGKGIEVMSELPYLVRNKLIVDNSHKLLATPKGYEEVVRSGTWSTVRYARKRKRLIHIVYPDGRVKEETDAERSAG